MCLKGHRHLLVKRKLLSAVSVLLLLSASKQPNPELGKRWPFLVSKLGWPLQIGKCLFHLITAHWKGNPHVLPAKLGRREQSFTCADPLLPPGMGPTLLVSTHMVAQGNDSQLQLSNNFLDNLDTKIVFISEIVLFGFVCLSLGLVFCCFLLFCGFILFCFLALAQNRLVSLSCWIAPPSLIPEKNHIIQEGLGKSDKSQGWTRPSYIWCYSATEPSQLCAPAWAACLQPEELLPSPQSALCAREGMCKNSTYFFITLIQTNYCSVRKTCLFWNWLIFIFGRFCALF